MSHGLKLFCPAKINLALSVGGPRPGDGYHPICSWMVRVSLGDDLTIERSAPSGQPLTASGYSIDWADDAPVKSPIDWPVEKDLIVKAHRLVEQRVGRALPVRAVLRKRSPVGAGMGGGSSDGAGMLRGLDELFDLKLSRETMMELAAKLGSDVGFFLGGSSGVISGVGEKLEDAPLGGQMHLALILPELHCNTRTVYLKFDEVSKTAVVDDARVWALVRESAAQGRSLNAEGPFNDLAEAAFEVEPQLRKLRGVCEYLVGRPVHVTGSGAAMFVVCADAKDSAAVAQRISEQGRVKSLAVAVVS
jgi:4-diphosphocytidyl-2-C-methyl-D-erythritol kinase